MSTLKDTVHTKLFAANQFTLPPKHVDRIRSSQTACGLLSCLQILLLFSDVSSWLDLGYIFLAKILGKSYCVFLRASHQEAHGWFCFFPTLSDILKSLVLIRSVELRNSDEGNSANLV